MDRKATVRTDPRVERSKERVLTDAAKLLVQQGLAGVSVDEVARRSGVSKATIYRHWPSRNALLVDACYTLGSKPETPNTGALKSDLSLLLDHFADQLQNASWPAVLPSIMDAAERDPELARLHWQMSRDIFQPFFEVMEAAKQRSELSQTQDNEELLEALLAPLFFRRYHSKQPIKAIFLARVVDLALRLGTTTAQGVDGSTSKTGGTAADIKSAKTPESSEAEGKPLSRSKRVRGSKP